MQIALIAFDNFTDLDLILHWDILKRVNNTLENQKMDCHSYLQLIFSANAKATEKLSFLNVNASHS